MDIREEIITKLIKQKAETREEFRAIVAEVYKKYKEEGYLTNVQLREKYDKLLAADRIEPNPGLEKLLVTKRMRSLSGVSIITVLTKPYDCPGQCIFCPTEVDVPKSYLSNEPAVMRAILNDYDPYKQVKTRLDSLQKQGHPVDKIELIVIGGTFNYLPKDYQEEFIKRCFDAMNEFDSVDLEDAKSANERAKVRCVGLTLETRPDYITPSEVAWFRVLGATRVELGVQHINDKILKLNGRGHTVRETVIATRILKDAGFKITYHLMPNLYGSNIDEDKRLFEEIFENPDFMPDYIKIYPCMVIEGTPLFELYKRGEFQPYSDDELIDLLKYLKKKVPCYIRIMRAIRDIPATSIAAGSTTSNLRQIVLEMAKKEGWSCGCIRCREAKSSPVSGDASAELFTYEYEASKGTEVFFSIETKDRKTLYSLVRARFPFVEKASTVKMKKSEFKMHPEKEELYRLMPELLGAALIREVHTYGQEVGIGDRGNTQHRGFGKKLIAEAERAAKNRGYNKVAVISGVGVREYYQKLGYELVGEYMVKEF